MTSISRSTLKCNRDKYGITISKLFARISLRTLVSELIKFTGQTCFPSTLRNVRITASLWAMVIWQCTLSTKWSLYNLHKTQTSTSLPEDSWAFHTALFSTRCLPHLAHPGRALMIDDFIRPPAICTERGAYCSSREWHNLSSEWDAAGTQHLQHICNNTNFQQAGNIILLSTEDM